MNTKTFQIPPVLLSFRTPLIALANAGVFVVSWALSFALRFDFAIPDQYFAVLTTLVLPVVTLKLAIFWLFGTLHGWWRYVTFRDLVGFAPPLLAGAVLLLLANFFLPSPIPKSIIIIDVLVSGGILAAVRSSWRVWTEPVSIMRSRSGLQRAFMISNHHETLVLANQINSQHNSQTQIVGILTHSKYPRGTTRAGMRILGSPHDAPELALKHNATEVWLVAGSIPGPELATLKQRYDEHKLITRVIPAATDRNDSGGFIPVRDIEINDLLQRDAVELDNRSIASQVEGRVVMVTGAGGSIGSEICRQLLKFSPRRLILVDHRENSVFLIHNELQRLKNPLTQLVPAVGDILDMARMRYLFESDRPDLVYHAAAHKHVGLMEENPGEAVKNNILGTRRIADLAAEFLATKFVLVSTDKAVNPTSVMGCTKQVAERYVLSLGSQSGTQYVVVRFGNVLGSNGSVVPIFKEQISRGGPLTITDPRMTRFFMTIPEASQLVLQAGAMGQGGEIFVLDMGEQVKIVDLAKKMIQLAGLPETAIEIRFTGARPGEKLYEELYFAEETTIPTPHKKIFAAKHRVLEFRRVMQDIDGLLQHAHQTPDEIRDRLKSVVPEYQWAAVPSDPVAAEDGIEEDGIEEDSNEWQATT